MSTSSDRIPVADRTRTGSAHTYLVIQGILIAISQVVPRPLHDVIQFLVSGGAVGALIFGIVTGRARPALGWALVAGGVLSLIAVGITIFVLYGPQGPNITISTVVPAAVSALTYPLLAAGLAILSRQTPRRGPADVLDATMTALAAYLLLWTFVLEPAVDHNAGPLAGAVAFPIGILLVFAIAVKLVLSGGLRDPSTRLLLLGVAALLTADGLTLIPAVRTSTIRAGVLVTVLWLIYSAAMGGAGLYPTAVRRQRRDSSSSNDTSWRRMALFAVLALVTPIAWAGEFAHHGNSRLERVGVTVSVVTAAIFLLLLVTRLGLIARVAQRQAKQLTEANLEQVDLQRELAYRAVHDPLTGLPNRVVLAERMEAVLARATGHHAILLLDLDGFKDINDSLGHPTGDEMLVEIARRMREVTPPNATLTRLGGDEFAAFVEDTDLAGAMRLADAYLEALRRPYTIGGRELFLTTSIGLYLMESGDVAGRGITESGDVAGRGITESSDVGGRGVTESAPSTTPSEALRDADLALYAAKEAGRNRVMVFHPALRTARLDHTRISSGLRHALARDEFVLHYEPVVDLETNKAVAVEALLRWRPHGGQLVPPADFIPIAESTGLILPIGAWALRQACRDARPWWDEYHVGVSVNVSGRQLDDVSFADTVIAALASAGLPGTALIIEITESNLVETAPTKDFHAQLHRLRAHGIRIAIDDFGTGYSSLSSIASLPVDIVKIDKSFTQAHGGSNFAPGDWAFTRGILQLVESLHMIAVAEGVETAEQEQELRLMGCPLAQGYYFARPTPADVIDRQFAARAATVR